ncbi:aldehyde dehydrogenase family protein [Sinimarinibacterium sp. NLF-5-8]|uniref:aldehyde dehydrogenase family protein n=1 Tax=Sinimarinibacterium sp. NLF-5-8 TaxID=2698684 RepID=UPI00137C001C|nr:aldehyde dehydrogenase family protein [Sinimarinibacterium sp. NLF-5-8]QHS10157.1 aldehyde dehydrogenase family protein [Sinimarinibacterium sp. NLF-5-8]
MTEPVSAPKTATQTKANIKTKGKARAPAATTGAEMLSCINPATGEVLGQVPAVSPEQVQLAVARARLAQKAWACSSFAQRRRVLEHLLRSVLERTDEICESVVQSSGKTWENALLGEVMTVCAKLRWVIDNGERHLKSEKVGSGILPHKRGRIDYVPLGVVACIVPWNYPFQNIFGSVAAPLMAGNAVIIKPSEAVAWSSALFQSLLDEALQSEGFSADTVQIVDGAGATGAALVRAGVQKILFIGSAGNGRRIIEGSAQTLTPVIMELGGKDPFIVCDDADLDQALHAALGGCFINLGQNCVASERLIVQAPVYDAFIEKVTAATRALRQGVPTGPGTQDVGAVCTAQQMQVIETLVNDALEKGARALAGGKRLPGQGNFFPPTILVDVTPQMRIAREEVFGPVMLIFKVADDAEAIALANSTEFGLQASVITRDRARGQRLAAQLESGGVCINDFGMCYLNQDLPFGGVKASGFGAMNGRDGLRAYTCARAVLEDRFGFSVLPKIYPVKPGDYAKAKGMIRLLFGRGLAQKARALRQLIKPQ